MSLRARAAFCYVIALFDAITSAINSDASMIALGIGMILVGAGFEKMWRSSQ